jgi:leucine proline-enriched proteoglycan (leprecan)
LSNFSKEILYNYFKYQLKGEVLYDPDSYFGMTADSLNNRSDMSHAVHADNCNLLENGECPKIPPAYTWRDFR